jgi:hypothetical protein
MPRINIQVVGFIEIEPNGCAEFSAEEPSALWDDLRSIAGDATYVPSMEKVPRWKCAGVIPADVRKVPSGATFQGRLERSRNIGEPGSSPHEESPMLYADLPRLSSELDAELGCLFARARACS